MDNSKKYELIVKIKELMIETDVNSNADIKNSQKISLNACKVLKQIYDIEETEPIINHFTDKVNKIDLIKSDIKEYEKIVNLRQKQILAQIPHKYIDEYIDSIFLYSGNDFLINVFAPCYSTTNYIPLWTNMRIDAYKLYDAINHRPISLFNLIDLILYCDVDIHDLTEMDITEMLFETITLYPDEADNELYNLFQYGIDKDENRMFIKKYYDYYFLSNFENNVNYTYSNNFNFNFYLLIAYRKVLFDLLEYIYTMDLSEQEIEKRKQKQEQFLKKQQREQFISKLTDAEKDLFEFIENNLDLSAKAIAKIKNKSENTVKKQIRNIMENTNNKKGGLKDLKKLIRLFS